MKRFAMLCLFLISLAFPAACRAEGLSLGVGYPYASLKYDFKALAAEGRFVTGSGVQAYTGRGYWNFHQSDKLKGFTGLEGGYIKFDTLDTKGTGSEAALFVGGEYFMSEKLSLMLDFAPTLISLKSDDTDVSCVEYVVNMGFYYHFGGSQSKAEVPNADLKINKTALKSDGIPVVSTGATFPAISLSQVVPVSTDTLVQVSTVQVLTPLFESTTTELHLDTQPVSGILTGPEISVSSPSVEISSSGLTMPLIEETKSQSINTQINTLSTLEQNISPGRQPEIPVKTPD